MCLNTSWPTLKGQTGEGNIEDKQANPRMSKHDNNKLH